MVNTFMVKHVVYDFDELTSDIQDKVVEKYYDINVDFPDWDEFTLDDWKTKLESLGFENVDIQYSGFSCQGDGASFTAKSINIPKFIKSNKLSKRFASILYAIKRDGYVCGHVVNTSSHYCHEYTVKAGLDIEWYDNNSKFYDKLLRLIDDLQDTITENVRSLSRQIYSDLNKEYDYLTGREAIVETIKSNDYTFTIDGVMDNQ